jgi:hypothetical protein
MTKEKHSALIYKWRLLPGRWLNNGLSPQDSSVAIHQLQPCAGFYTVNGLIRSQ